MRAKIPYQVQCKSNYQWFETIAAFDCEYAAKAYAQDCAKAHPRFKYHVNYRGKITAIGEGNSNV